MYKKWSTSNQRAELPALENTHSEKSLNLGFLTNQKKYKKVVLKCKVLQKVFCEKMKNKYLLKLQAVFDRSWNVMPVPFKATWDSDNA